MLRFFIIVLLSFTFNSLSEASHGEKLPSAVVVGTVYCDTCFQEGFSRTSHFISGASVAVECKDGKSKPSFREEAKTDEHGEFRVGLPLSVSKHVKKIKGCSVKLLSSSEPFCAVASTTSTSSSSFQLKSRKQGTQIFSAGFFTFKPEKQPILCNQKPSIQNSREFNYKKTTTSPPPFVNPTFPPPLRDPSTPDLPPLPLLPGLPPLPELPPLPPLPRLPGLPPIPGTNKKTKTSESFKTTKSADQKVGKQPDQFGIPNPFFPPILQPPPLIPPLLPPNPLQPPPAPLIPNPFQPPPAPFIPNPFQPPPAPFIPNPFQPSPSPLPLIPLPPIPGLTPSPPPPPPPSLPLPPFPPLPPLPRLPPLPLVPPPAVPGIPPASSSSQKTSP